MIRTGECGGGNGRAGPRLLVGALLLSLVLGGCRLWLGDRQPSFGGLDPGPLDYWLDQPIAPLELPAASRGNGRLRYRLTPTVPGLTFTAATRTLSGTPRRTGSYPMTYEARDADDDRATAKFTITVRDDDHDARASAPRVTPGVRVPGRIDSATDVDYFQIELPLAGTLVATTTGQVATDLTIVDADGRAHVPLAGGPSEDAPGQRTGAVHVAVSAGIHYVRVTGSGSSTGEYTLAVRFHGCHSVKGAGSSLFVIDLCYWQTAPTRERHVIFTQAAAYWAGALTDDLPEVRLPGASCFSIPLSDAFPATVDDLLVIISFTAIDGPGGILAQGGVCLVRGDGTGLPVVGGMRFDTADLDHLESGKRLYAVAVHELAHALGFGILGHIGLWGQFLRKPDSAAGEDPDTHFDGALAIAEFDALGPVDEDHQPYSGAKVPVENDSRRYGPGSLDVHWRESVFGSELMTPTINRGDDPISRVTLASFEDLRYKVNYAAAQPFTLPRGPPAIVQPDDPDAPAAAEVRAPGAVELGDDIWRGPIQVVDADGNLLRSIDGWR